MTRYNQEVIRITIIKYLLQKVILMDDREQVKKLTFYRSHSKPVLAVKVTDRQVLSLSEDQTLVVYDRVAGKRFKRISIPGEQEVMSNKA